MREKAPADGRIFGLREAVCGVFRSERASSEGPLQVKFGQKKCGIATFRGSGPFRPLFCLNCASTRNSMRESGRKKRKRRKNRNALRDIIRAPRSKREKKNALVGVDATTVAASVAPFEEEEELLLLLLPPLSSTLLLAALLLRISLSTSTLPLKPQVPLWQFHRALWPSAAISTSNESSLVEPPWQAGQSPRTCLPGVYCLSAIFFSSRRSRTVGLSPLPSREARAESEREEEEGGEEEGGSAEEVAEEALLLLLLICCWTSSGRSVASERGTGAGARVCLGAGAAVRGAPANADDEAEAGALRRCCCC